MNQSNKHRADSEVAILISHILTEGTLEISSNQTTILSPTKAVCKETLRGTKLSTLSTYILRA